MKYYYTYRVNCTAVGWEDYYYLGQHITTDLTDGYKGSGVKLQEYYNQYPNDYTFTILEFYSNKTELNVAEQKLIGDLWKTDEYCLNCTAGVLVIGVIVIKVIHTIQKKQNVKFQNH